MSLPSRLSVFVSESSSPGVAGSGICFTQTAMFIPLLFAQKGRRRFWPARAAHVEAIGSGARGGGFADRRRTAGACDGDQKGIGGTVAPMSAVDVLVVGAGPAGAAAALAAR